MDHKLKERIVLCVVGCGNIIILAVRFCCCFNTYLGLVFCPPYLVQKNLIDDIVLQHIHIIFSPVNVNPPRFFVLFGPPFFEHIFHKPAFRVKDDFQLRVVSFYISERRRDISCCVEWISVGLNCLQFILLSQSIWLEAAGAALFFLDIVQL